ncbi:hypothetical protein ES707_08553 [subsurface metagenome]|jgi:hypothetical protein
MIDWQVESLRLVLFRAKPIETVIPLWGTLTGEKPEKVNSQPRANIIIEEGTVVLGSLAHFSDPLRINWTLSPSKEQQQKTASFPTLGSLFETKDQFIKMMNDWLSSDAAPETNRIALGSVSLIVNDNKASAYKQLSTLLHHVTIDIENSTDFFYQINRPIQSTVEPDLIINRLSKWNAIRAMGLGLLVGEKSEVIQESIGYSASRLELDINTHQSNKKIFSKEKLIPLLQELSKFGDQISTEGDK